MLNLKAAFYRFLAESNPGNIPLSHMKYTGGIIGKIMYLSFHHRLKIFLHLSTINQYFNSQWKHPSFFHIINFRAEHFYFSILNFRRIGHMEKLYCFTPVSAEFNISIFLPYSLSFKSRTKRYGNINLVYSNLKTPYFYSFCNDFIIGNIRNYMLICTYPPWKYLGDRGISYSRKPIIYGTGSICVFFFIYFTQSQHKCKHPVFIIKKHSS